MADDITEEERVLIDEAIAEGRVTKVPMGVTSVDNVGFIYNPNSNRIIHLKPGNTSGSARAARKWGMPTARVVRRDDNG